MLGRYEDQKNFNKINRRLKLRIKKAFNDNNIKSVMSSNTTSNISES